MSNSSIFYPVAARGHRHLEMLHLEVFIEKMTGFVNPMSPIRHIKR